MENTILINTVEGLPKIAQCPARSSLWRSILWTPTNPVRAIGPAWGVSSTSPLRGAEEQIHQLSQKYMGPVPIQGISRSSSAFTAHDRG